MFKQRRKDRTRSTSCTKLKHIFPKNKGKCLCANYYKDNGRIYREKGDRHVAGTTADFCYKSKTPTKKAAKRRLRNLLRA
jgi:hypothetical protein